MGQGRVRALAALVHAALALLLVGTLLDARAGLLAVPLLAGAVALFLIDTADHLRRRMRRPVELSTRHYLAAGAFPLLALALAATGAYPAAVASLLAGFLPLMVAGMLVKVLSFLVWQHRYASRAGRAPVPMLRDMPLPGLERATLWGLGLGGLGVTAALALHHPLAAALGAAAGAAGAWALCVQCFRLALADHLPAPLPEEETA